LRYFFTRRIPPFDRVLLVESGSRSILNRLVPVLYERFGQALELDLLTCFPGAPDGFRGRVYRVNEYRDSAARGRLYRELAGRRYSLAGIVCSAEPIMTKWKWMMAARLRSKIFIINENADFLFLDHAHWRHIAHFVRVRLGLSGAAVIPTLARVLFFPVSLAYLLLFAGVVHLRRKLRLARGGA
jgi:hypothetical protein